MPSLIEIDKNFFGRPVEPQQFELHPVSGEPFVIEGFPWRKEGVEYYRLPGDLTKEEVNEGALNLAYQTSGGAIRFATDSPHIAIRAQLFNSSVMPHCPPILLNGFDCYRVTPDLNFQGIARQPELFNNEILSQFSGSPEGKLCTFQVNMPCFSGVKDIEIGIVPGSRLEAPVPHRIADPILFYGSSITHGACASRPGNSYPMAVCRELDAPLINLGFSGCCRGETVLAERIGKLKLSAFVLDYDHNAPSVEHLAKTHEAFFRKFREFQPELPVLVMSRCNFFHGPETLERRRIIRTTVEHALAAGDRHVRFLDGEFLFEGSRRIDCTVDNCHPNDLGFYRMTKAVLPRLRELLKK